MSHQQQLQQPQQQQQQQLQQAALVSPPANRVQHGTLAAFDTSESVIDVPSIPVATPVPAQEIIRGQTYVDRVRECHQARMATNEQMASALVYQHNLLSNHAESVSFASQVNAMEARLSHQFKNDMETTLRDNETLRNISAQLTRMELHQEKKTLTKRNRARVNEPNYQLQWPRNEQGVGLDAPTLGRIRTFNDIASLSVSRNGIQVLDTVIQHYGMDVGLDVSPGIKTQRVQNFIVNPLD